MNNNTLNQPQQEAVTALHPHVLVLAGAGSGKTRVLIHRIAWLMHTQHVNPHAILAVTFTNKAAREMRQRIEELCQRSTQSLWVGTFHGLSHRLLRQHWQAAGLQQAFQIIDSDDQLRLIKRITKGMQLSESQCPPKQSQWFINKQKEEGLRANDVEDDGSLFSVTQRGIYQEYERICQQSSLVDFTELLLRSLELLHNNPSITTHYQQRFKHILVDEFQDTNTLQYRWIRAFAGEQSHVMAVGDDDQSIYSWRGAKIENIQHFENDFPGAKLIRLEQNYRSTQTILSAANAVIEKNPNRLGKSLWSDGDKGAPLTVFEASDEYDEAHHVVHQMKRWHDQGIPYARMAVLYRSNAQSRVLEEACLQARLPYRIYGGHRFFDRAEIKDAMAYLRLAYNPHDDAALERIINTPTRGIGAQTLQKLRAYARDAGCSAWQSIQHAVAQKSLSPRATRALEAFTVMIQALHTTSQTESLKNLGLSTLEQSQLREYFNKDKSEKGQSRIENLNEWLTALEQFHLPDEAQQSGMGTLEAFLAHVSLEAGEKQADEHSDAANLMTLHAAKGLEFQAVHMVGLEEGLFPNKMAMDSPRGLEEERRLCYVGMTRAKQKLHLTYASFRRVFGSQQYQSPSRFLNDIPKDLAERIGGRRHSHESSRGYTTPAARKKALHTTLTQNSSQHGLPGIAIGQDVRHPTFGRGTVLQCEGEGAAARVAVQFETVGLKWLVAKFAKLQSAT